MAIKPKGMNKPTSLAATKKNKKPTSLAATKSGEQYKNIKSIRDAKSAPLTLKKIAKTIIAEGAIANRGDDGSLETGFEKNPTVDSKKEITPDIFKKDALKNKDLFSLKATEAQKESFYQTKKVDESKSKTLNGMYSRTGAKPAEFTKDIFSKKNS
ncbi:MAG: hypothetical protein LBC44_01300 [Mycoplasmataceae bacterium]|jgi:hypothetical protein|nr:hypothetical protein [Mycoplasmataceae bacterium]